MPSPNKHPPANVFFPTDLRQLLAPLSLKPLREGLSGPFDANAGYLKKAKGLKSLTIELSWRFVSSAVPRLSLRYTDIINGAMSCFYSPGPSSSTGSLPRMKV